MFKDQERPGLTARDILLLTQVPGYPRHFVLSPFERPVSVTSQQVRALNLVYALLQEHVLARTHRGREATRRTPRLAVIGAGAAGVTAAAYAAMRGCKVTVFEKQRRELTLFSDSSRYLHPRLFDWPDPDWDFPEVELPVMVWKRNAAKIVCESLYTQWHGWKTLYEADSVPGTLVKGPTIDCHRNVKVDLVPPRGGSKAVCLKWSDGSVVGKEWFDAIVLAVGFGPEKLPSDDDATLKCLSYWDERPEDLLNLAGHIFVSGNGDGGLAEIAHISINKFSYEDVAEWLNEYCGSSVADEVRRIDREAQRRRDGGDPDRSEFLTKCYTKLAKDIPGGPLSIKNGVTLVVNGKSKGLLTDDSYALHRLLVAWVKSRMGTDRFRYVKAARTAAWQDDKTVRVWIDDSVKVFDQAIFRRGPRYNLERDFHEIFESAESVLRFRGYLQQLGRPIWPAPFERMHRSHDRENAFAGLQGEQVLYSDFFGPQVQQLLYQASGTHSEEFFLLFHGRLRLQTLLRARVMIIAQQLLDGAFFRRAAHESSGYRDIFFSLDPIEWVLRSHKRPAAEAVKETERSIFVDKNGQIRPGAWFYSTGEAAESIYQQLIDLPQVAGAWNARRILESLTANDVTLTATRILQSDWEQIEAAVQQKQCRLWLNEDPFWVRQFEDPVGLYARLQTPAGRDLLFDVFRQRNKDRPRTETSPLFDDAYRSAEQSEDAKGLADIHRIQSWFNYAYHRSIALVEKASVIETVWVDHWDFPGHTGSEGNVTGLIRSLGRLDMERWSTLRQRLSLSGFSGRWTTGLSSTQAYIEKIVEILREISAVNESAAEEPSEEDSWRWRLHIWLDGPLTYDDRWLPPRCDVDQDSPRVQVFEYGGASRRLLSVTEYSRRLWEPRPRA
jgi:hypothetical protein